MMTENHIQKLIISGMSIFTVPIDDKWFEFDHQKDIDIFNSLYGENF